MQPQTTTQGRIRDTPLKITFKKLLQVLRKELCPLVTDVLSKNSYKFVLVSEKRKLDSAMLVSWLFTCLVNLLVELICEKTLSFKESFVHEICLVGLLFWFGFFKTDHSVAICPLTALAKQIDTLEAFKDGAIFFTPSSGSFETIVL